ncbi:octopamine receptor Oamb isoform X1 [Microplitis demolitor]|uniref:octopamine receptor Oamb isoform X1 n=1 Tax=Microplitis demolitor TaxID=69319 RepID=UPI0004CD1C80|nr:octopamine receptor Oamb isoform X1 [Microplitis demolitor]XP_008558340.1 octopamine receptor Oamb isoform X1 [Microplitis demolitor]XP_008558341.1 octopamine receptor Oamb isoform X1 [Microplitis demolitor]XP_008558342.1 octopamine receptor Oamb isoform X1 [Microplitis demolitor]
MRDLNAYNCNKLYEDVEWSGPGIVGTLVVLAFVDIMVILGNVLVILAVYHTTKLRNVTNMFIVSLAVADLLVGVAVLPFSATWEVFKVWIFGDLWCSVWLAVDVWMCTASILNLCAISLDRYLAVTRPVSYPQIMSPKRAKLLVAAVWVLSFVICFPPLVGWKDQRSNPQRNDVSTLDDSGPYNETRIFLQPKPCPWICELTNDAGYVVYSALGSFYIPTLVMLFFYWRIYNAAVSTTKAINQGFRTTKGSKMLGSRFDEQRLTLRIHRGRGSVYNGGANNSNTSPKSPEANRSASVRKDKIKISVSYPSTETLNTKCNTLERTPSKCSQISVHYNSNGQTQSHLCPSSRSTHLKVGGINRVGSSRRPSRRSSCESQVTGDEVSLRELTPGSEEKPRVMRMGKRNIKAQVKRFRMETKAAKTLGIIVGGFILCWLPFFTMYLVRAFCPNCIHPTVFSVLFWLGYCNSAINPCIYALFSKDFRFAFKRIICNCFCKRKKNSLRRGSDGSQLATRNDRSPNYSIRVPQHGVSIEDSDPEHNVHSGSDSR